MNDAQQQAIELALSQAKRVSRESRLLVKQLAQLRDNDLNEDLQSGRTQDNEYYKEER